MTGYVYMTASQKRGTIYIGVDLGRRVPEHKSGQGSGFTSPTACNALSGTRNISISPMQSNVRSP